MKIILMMAQTMDGKIAKDSNHFPDWTSKEDKEKFAKISKQAGIVIMGEKTFKTFKAPLKDRLNVVFTYEKNLPSVEGVKWVSGEPAAVILELEKMGYKSAILGGGSNLNTLFLEKKLINEIIITIEPKIFGDGLSIFAKPLETNLNLLEMEKLSDNTILLRYKVNY